MNAANLPGSDLRPEVARARTRRGSRWRVCSVPCVAYGLLVAACLPDVEVDASVISSRRIVYVAAEPAEAAPGDVVSMRAAVADRDGPIEVAPLRWASCLARRPLTEQGPVAATCLDTDAADALVVHGEGVSVDLTVDVDACKRFGPEPPPAVPGEPAGRPVDPDATGGYYLPIQVWDSASEGPPVIALLRIDCGISGANQATAAEFKRRYQRNRAPAISALEADAPIALDGSGQLSVSAGERVNLQVAWADCPREPDCGDGWCTLDETVEACAADCDAPSTPGCDGAEAYVTFELGNDALTARRESLSISWLTTIGRFEEARTGRAEADLEHTSENEFVAPEEPGEGTAWVVVRDARGGVSAIAFTIRVE